MFTSNGRWRLAATVFSLLAGTAGTARAAPATGVPAGIWQWDDGRAAVEFHPCGDALCGRIVWVTQEAVPHAAPLLDVKNPDPALRARRVCGVDYITGLHKTPDGGWRKGRVYDFNGGSSYDLDIDAVDVARVKMRGYKGMRLLGANLVLVRPKFALPPCNAAD